MPEVANRASRWRKVVSAAKVLVAGMNPQPVVVGVERVPAEGPCVLLPNHYERPDHVWVGWGAIVITAALAERRAHRGAIR
jgi:hypothetical protein